MTLIATTSHLAIDKQTDFLTFRASIAYSLQTNTFIKLTNKLTDIASYRSAIPVKKSLKHKNIINIINDINYFNSNSRITA